MANRIIFKLMNTSTTGTSLPYRQTGQRGFTIIEMSVVLVLFMLVIGTVVTIFVSIVQHQKRALENQQFLNQASYASEYLSRGLRTSVRDESGTCLTTNYIYMLTRYNAESGFYEGVKYVTSDGVCHEVYADGYGVLQEIKDNGEPTPILSAQFVVNNIRFIVNGDKALPGVSQSSGVQPRITFLLHLKAHGTSLEQQDKIIQSTVSQRNLNIP